MQLSKRLLTVAGAVSPCACVADVGTDHGFVPIYLVEKGVCERALAMDVNQGPLDRAKEHVAEEVNDGRMAAGRIQTRLSDGLASLLPGEADAIIIAGMGGMLMSRILTNGADVLKNKPQLILQPQSDWTRVRETLEELGYVITWEDFLQEEGKYYVVIKAEEAAGESGWNYTPAEYIYGKILIDNRHPVFLEYLKREHEKKKSLVEKLSGSGEERRQSRVEELIREIEMIENII